MRSSADYTPRSRRRRKGVAKSSRSHAIVIEDDEEDIQRKSLLTRARSFLQHFGDGPRKTSMKEQENTVYMRKVPSPTSSRRLPTDTVRTEASELSTGRDLSTSVRNRKHSKLDWWFPAKAAFGRKKDVAVEELFNRLTRPSTAGETYSSFLVRDSVDVDKIETNQTQWIDRGRGYFAKQRKKNKQAALVQTGTHAGRSCVKLAGIKNMTWHRLRHDAFSSLISMHFSYMIMIVIALYLSNWFFFGLVWTAMDKIEPDCLQSTTGFLDGLVMSISTANTIGYGTRAIRPDIGGDLKCIGCITVLCIQRLTVIIMDALLVGVLFSKLSQPKKRSRTIFISDSAVVCQRDGILKFMFRVGDARQTTIIRPCIQAYLYTFNPSRRRTTLEGEFLPNRVAPLKLEVMDESLLLPILVSHVIDETSPLYGMTKMEMEELKAEIVVTFVAVNSETGSEFAARQSYLPSEIFYGFQFCKIIKTMVNASDDYKYHAIDLAKFHDIEPQKLWSNVFMTQNEISRVLMNSIGNAVTVPIPVLGDNTLVISGAASLVCKNKKLRLSLRVGDVFPPAGQYLHAKVFAYYYPWKVTETEEGSVLDYSCQELSLGTEANPKSNDLFLRVPVLVEHTIDKHSPLSKWTTRDGFIADSSAEILVIVYGTNQVNQATERVQRTYKVADGHVKCGYVFSEIVSPPMENPDGKPKVAYDQFHEMQKAPPPPDCLSKDKDKCWVYSHELFFWQAQRKPSQAPGTSVQWSMGVPDEGGSERDRVEATRYAKHTLGKKDSDSFTKLSEFFPNTSRQLSFPQATVIPTTSRRSREADVTDGEPTDGEPEGERAATGAATRSNTGTTYTTDSLREGEP